jgi:hypothetical protein
LESGKLAYKENWLFSSFEEKPRYDEFNEDPSPYYLPKTMKTTLGFESVQ